MAFTSNYATSDNYAQESIDRDAIDRLRRGSGSDDYSQESIDRDAIDKLRRGPRDYSNLPKAAEAARERSADNQVDRDRRVASFGADLGDRIANRDVTNKIRLNAAGSDSSSRENDKSRSAGDRDRDAASFASRSQLAASNAMANSNIESQDKIAQMSKETQLAESRANTDRAAIAAKAQVSSAILGGSRSYGGYW